MSTELSYYQRLSEPEREIIRARAKRWYENNRERVRQRQRERYGVIRARAKVYEQVNKERIQQRREKLKLKDPEWWKARERKYRQRYRMQRAAAENARRARKFLASGSHSEEQWLSRVRFYGWRCRYCRAVLTRETVTRDHMIPFSRGGSDWASNLVPCCHSCNACKRHRTFKEYIAILKRKNLFFSNPEIRFTQWQPNGNGAGK